MIVTTISRVFFHWYEYKEMVKFEAENPSYKQVAEDTTGTTYEFVTYYMMDTEGKKNDIQITY